MKPFSAVQTTLKRAAIRIGSLTLLIVMVVVAVNAMLRHVFVVVPGTIEVVMVVMTVTASMGLIVATLDRAHALVHLLIDRLSAETSTLLQVIVDILVCLFWVLVGVGGAWIVSDHWQQHEATVLIGIPLTPFRLLWLATCVIMAVFQIACVFSREPLRADDA
jgi:TRAP-type C4-dicarboxylate transport system permease small subunit